jgi:hypothetical protein
MRKTPILFNKIDFGTEIAPVSTEDVMSNSFMSPLPTFTLESLVTSGQWNAVQTNARKKAGSKINTSKKDHQGVLPPGKNLKPTL